MDTLYTELIQCFPIKMMMIKSIKKKLIANVKKTTKQTDNKLLPTHLQDGGICATYQQLTSNSSIWTDCRWLSVVTQVVRNTLV